MKVWMNRGYTVDKEQADLSSTHQPTTQGA